MVAAVSGAGDSPRPSQPKRKPPCKRQLSFWPGRWPLPPQPAPLPPRKTYDLDPGHSQIVFSYNHGGFSTTYGMFSGFGGQVSFDADAPENSSVSVSMPVRSMLTGWEKRFDHFMGADFFDAAGDEAVTFTSTGIEVTGEDTAHITGDLTINGVHEIRGA